MNVKVNIKKKYDNFYLDISFESKNNVIGLLGASGNGKSLTLKCIAGIETPDEGEIIINGKTVFCSKNRINLPPQKRGVGYLFQNYALFRHMTVEKNIEIAINQKKNSKEQIVKNLINNYFLTGLEKKYPYQLSGGEQQRVALARIIASEPIVLMLDEPFSALDTHLKWKLECEIQKTLKKFNGTTFLISHNCDEIYRICDDVAVLVNGKIEGYFQKEKLFDKPTTKDCAILTGWENVFSYEQTGDCSVIIKDLGITLNLDEAVANSTGHIAFKSNAITIVSSMQENCFIGEISDIISQQDCDILILKTKSQQFLRVFVDKCDTHRPNIDDAVFARLNNNFVVF